MINIENLTAGYNGQNTIRDISLTFKKDEISVLIGPNGCGKSTLLKTLCGIVPITQGRILFENADILTLHKKAIAQKMAYLPQSRNMPIISARRMVLHGRFPHLGYPKKYRKEDYDIVHTAMEQMGVLKYADTSIDTLSGGERQKVYLAMALAQSTPIVLLDEPTTYLDIYHQLDVIKLAVELKKQGKTVILVLHDLNLALQCADTIMVMDNGEIVTIAPPQEIISENVLEGVFKVKTEICYTKDGDRCYAFKLL